MASDATAKTVSFTLMPGYNQANSGMNFNGYSSGGLEIDVPKGWAVTVTCINRGLLNHSCVVVADEASSQAIFSGASTSNPGAGLPAGQQANFSFKPDRTGAFRIACLVPGHESAGMWIVFAVTASGSPAAYKVTS
jgi:uncharacterized cupredoxin-like copper-binding protein